MLSSNALPLIDKKNIFLLILDDGLIRNYFANSLNVKNS
jgi:hypothetical protein